MKYILILVALTSLLQAADISKIEIWYQAKDDGPYYVVIADSQLKFAVGAHLNGQFDNEIPISSDAVHNMNLYIGYIAKEESNKIDNPESAAKVLLTYSDGTTKERGNMFKTKEEREGNSIFKFFNDMATIVKYFKRMK